jgi:septum formation protein
MMMSHTERKIILASGSQFRKRMLESAGVPISVVPATVDEPAARAQMARESRVGGPGEIALRLAQLKAEQVSRRHPEALVIGADQVLALGDNIFGKPADLASARAQLLQLHGRVHTLPTGVVLAKAGQMVWQHLGVVELEMRAFSASFLDTYLASAGPAICDTVGGYMLEGLGVQLFERIAGDYFTVIGLPLLPLLAELRQRDMLPT